MGSQLPLKIASGEVDRMVAGTDFIPPSTGGTGQVTYTQGDVLIGNATAGLDKLPLGTSGQVLTSNGTSLAYATPTSITETVILTNDEAGALTIGQWLYPDVSTGGVKKAKADAAGTANVCGIALNAAASGAATTVQNSGTVTLTTGQWDAVMGTTGGLTFNTLYFLSPTTAGSGVGTAPDTTGQKLVCLGLALSTTKLKLGITRPMGL